MGAKLIVLLLVSVLALAIGVTFMSQSFVTNPVTPSPSSSQSPLPSVPSATADPNAPVVVTPLRNEYVTSPFPIKGFVQPGWMFEGTFPIELLDDRGHVIASTGATEVVPGSWQEGSPVEFTARLSFTTNATQGILVLKRDNPSGLPAQDKKIEIPVFFKKSGQSNKAAVCTGNNGRWLEKENECEGLSETICTQNDGVFSACESACRHNPDRNAACIEMCIAVCKF